MPKKITALVKKLLSIVAIIHLIVVLGLVFALAYPNPFKAFERTAPPGFPFQKGLTKETPYWFFHKPNCPSTILIAHGRSRDKSYMEPLISSIWNQSDVCIIAIDLPSHGERPYGTTTIGPREKSGIIDALQWLEQNQQQNIILYGVSMGGSAIIHALEETNTTLHIQGYITDGTYSDLSLLVNNIADSIYLPSYLKNTGVFLVNWLVNYELEAVLPKEISRNLPYPYLALHGNLDPIAPIESAQQLTEKNPLATSCLYNGGHDQPSNSEMQHHVLSFIEHVQKNGKQWNSSFRCISTE